MLAAGSARFVEEGTFSLILPDMERRILLRRLLSFWAKTFSASASLTAFFAMPLMPTFF